jgi:hypothetical protein
MVRFTANQEPLWASALAEARVENIHARRVRVNGTAGTIVLSDVVSEQGGIEIEGKGGDIRILDGKTAAPASR